MRERGAKRKTKTDEERQRETKREREREREREGERAIYLPMCKYIYIERETKRDK